MGQFIKIESDQGGIAKITYLPKSGEDGVYNWPENSLRSWRYCVGARLKFWRRSRVPKKGSRDLTRLY